MKVVIEEGVLTLRVKLSDSDLAQIKEGVTVIQARLLKETERPLDRLGVWRLNVEVCIQKE